MHVQNIDIAVKHIYSKDTCFICDSNAERCTCRKQLWLWLTKRILDGKDGRDNMFQVWAQEMPISKVDLYVHIIYIYMFVYVHDCSHIQNTWTKPHFVWFVFIITEELMCGHHAVAPIPGGFGAAAGPNDGWHCLLHSLTKSYLRAACGWGTLPQMRRRLDELQFSLQGSPSTKLLVAKECWKTPLNLNLQ